MNFSPHEIPSTNRLSKFLSLYPRWSVEVNCLAAIFEFKTINEIEDFKTILFKITQILNHNPEVEVHNINIQTQITGSETLVLKVKLQTHDLGNQISYLDLLYVSNLEAELLKASIFEHGKSQVTVGILNKSTNPDPFLATEGAACMDISAFLDEKILLLPHQIALIPTGLWLEIPQGYEILIRPRSGLAYRHGITLPNTPATIDSDYRGEIKIPLINVSTEEFTVENGMRIAQMCIKKVLQIKWHPQTNVSSTVRNSGGFGHTGI